VEKREKDGEKEILGNQFKRQMKKGRRACCLHRPFDREKKKKEMAQGGGSRMFPHPPGNTDESSRNPGKPAKDFWGRREGTRGKPSFEEGRHAHEAGAMKSGVPPLDRNPIKGKKKKVERKGAAVKHAWALKKRINRPQGCA